MGEGPSLKVLNFSESTWIYTGSFALKYAYSYVVHTCKHCKNCETALTGQRKAWLVLVGFSIGFGWFWMVLVQIQPPTYCGNPPEYMIDNLSFL